MTDPWRHTGAVLAGGASDRMGVPKESLLTPDGRSIIQTVLDVLDEVCSHVVVAGHRLDGRTEIPDLRTNSGPLAGIEAVLASGLDDQYLISASDTPLATPSLLRKLLESKSELTVFEVEGQTKIQSLPMRISAGTLKHVSRALDRGRYAIHDFIRGRETAYVPVSAEEGELLRSVNTPEDYKDVWNPARGASPN